MAMPYPRSKKNEQLEKDVAKRAREENPGVRLELVTWEEVGERNPGDGGGVDVKETYQEVEGI